MDDWQHQKKRMLDRDLKGRGIQDERLLAAMAAVPRELFLADSWNPYGDHAQAIGSRQTISQPYVVAFMLEALAPAPHERALDVGCGSGYAAAVLSRLCQHVTGLERIAKLALGAREALARAGCDNVEVHCQDGLASLQGGVFDLIQVAAACQTVPETLVEALAPGGRMILPLANSYGCQTLTLISRTVEDKVEKRSMLDVQFVPMLPGCDRTGS